MFPSKSQMIMAGQGLPIGVVGKSTHPIDIVIIPTLETLSHPSMVLIVGSTINYENFCKPLAT